MLPKIWVFTLNALRERGKLPPDFNLLDEMEQHRNVKVSCPDSLNCTKIWQY